jgi:PAS domain S-box-containing protein
MRALVIGEHSGAAEPLLVEAGLEVERAAPDEGAARLRERRFALLLIDGVELVRSLAPLAEAATLLARVASHAEMADALAAGAHDALILPGDEPRLIVRARLSAGGALAARRAADAQRRLAAEHLAFVERAADGVFTHRLDLKLAYVNQAFVSFLGYTSPNELLGRLVLDVVHADDRQVVRQRIRGILETQQPSRPRPIRFISRDGSILWAETRGIFVDAGDGPSVTVMARDITERRKAVELEEQLQQSQKMEAVGRLAGGVAHDFNNILTTIRGYGDLLLEQIEPGSRAHDAVQHIRRSTTRAAGLTEQLLVFTRRRPPQPKLVQLNDIVRQMGGLLKRVIGEDIRLELRMQRDLARTRVDPGQMEQMILNLAINARDAMANGGRLLIETRDHGAEQVRLTIEDEGCGMDDETRRHIFEPFFTTKSVGKGTGLGLSIVHAIVEQSGGTILVDSAPGRGARFHIFLPRVEDSSSLPERVTPLPMPGTGPVGHETILLAEDDEEVRDFVEHVLRRAGYKVLAASDGASALKVAQGFPGEIALLLSDVVMPHVNGQQLAEELLPQRPRLKVLHMSGYPGDTIARYGDVREGGAFLQKPFSARELAEKVRAILDELV